MWCVVCVILLCLYSKADRDKLQLQLHKNFESWTQDTESKNPKQKTRKQKTKLPSFFYFWIGEKARTLRAMRTSKRSSRNNKKVGDGRGKRNKLITATAAGRKGHSDSSSGSIVTIESPSQLHELAFDFDISMQMMMKSQRQQ